MKKLLSLIFISIFVLSFANNKTIEPIITKFAIANYEVLNIDKGTYLFKRNHCEDKGYTMFSPFFTNPELLYTTFDSQIDDNNEIIVNTKGEKESTKYIFNNFKSLENGNKVSFDIVIGNKVFNSYISGSNLDITTAKNFLSAGSNIQINQLCPPCAVIAVIAVAKVVSDVCTTASKGCSPCNGTLQVSACSCSCTPK